jgi:hypothetical protein
MSGVDSPYRSALVAGKFRRFARMIMTPCNAAPEDISHRRDDRPHWTANYSHFRHRDKGRRVSMASDRVEGFCVTELSGNDIKSNDRSQLGLRAKR